MACSIPWRRTANWWTVVATYLPPSSLIGVRLAEVKFKITIADRFAPTAYHDLKLGPYADVYPSNRKSVGSIGHPAQHATRKKGVFEKVDQVVQRLEVVRPGNELFLVQCRLGRHLGYGCPK
jgi:hypothetical protein